MKETNYSKYICTKLYKRENLPGPTPAERDALAADGLRISMEHVLWIDSDVIPGAYYGETTWIWPSSYPNQVTPAELAKRMKANQKPMFPHDHGFPELLSWWGTDLDHPEDTTAMSMLMGDEEIPLDKSWVAYIPAGIPHMPMRIPGGKVTTKPVHHWTSGPGGIYDREKEGQQHKADSKDKELMPPKPGSLKPGNLNKKYFVYGYAKGVKRPAYMRDMDPKYSRPVAYIDDTVIPGAEFGCDTMWLLPGNQSKAGQPIMDKRTLPHGTSITMSAMNYPDITDLCAEAELWIGGEKHLINKNFGAYLPPGVECGPLVVRNISNRIFLMMSQPCGAGIKKYPGGK